jgi:WD40 repeat protein
VSALSFHPDGTLLASAVSVGDPDDPEGFRLEIWSVDGGNIIHTIFFDGPVDSAAFSNDGRILAVGVRGTVRLLDTATWKEMMRLGRNESRDMVSVNFDHSDRLVAAVGWDDSARVWNISDGKEVARLDHERDVIGPGRVSAIALSPSGRYAATTDGDIVRVWLMDTYRSNHNRPARVKEYDRRLHEFGNIVPPDPGEKDEAVDHEGRPVLRWEGEQATIINPASQLDIAKIVYPAPILRGYISPDGHLAALVGSNGSARVFDATSGRELTSLRHADHVEMVALSSSASMAGFITDEGSLEVFSTTDGHPLSGFKLSEPVKWIRFSPTGKWLLASADGIAFTAIQVLSGQAVVRFSHDRPISEVLFADNDRYLATASPNDGTARIWDLEKNREILHWYLQTNLASVDISFVDNNRIFEFIGTEFDDRKSSLSDLWRPDELIQAACRTVARNLREDEWRRYFPPWKPLRPTCIGMRER